jgi:hypothetical protein
MSQLDELLIADGGLECCPQPWKCHLEHALALIDRLQTKIHELELSQSIGGSVDCIAAKRSRDETSNMPTSCFGRPSFAHMVFMPLAVAIEAWKTAGETKTRHALTKFNIVASVVKWGVPKRTKGMITSYLKRCARIIHSLSRIRLSCIGNDFGWLLHHQSIVLLRPKELP